MFTVNSKYTSLKLNSKNVEVLNIQFIRLDKNNINDYNKAVIMCPGTGRHNCRSIKVTNKQVDRSNAVRHSSKHTNTTKPSNDLVPYNANNSRSRRN